MLFIILGFALNLFFASTAFATSPTLNLSLSSGTVSLELVALDNAGTFASSNNLSISASTNNYSGYTLSISSNTANAPLNGPLNGVNTETLDSIGLVSGVTSTGISADVFSNSSNTQYNNKWGYKPSKRNSIDNTNFLPAPSITGDVLDVTSSANDVVNTYTMSIGARVTPTTLTGTYSNTFVIAAVANLINYSITYNANDGNNGADTTNMPITNPQTGSVDTNTTTVTLSSSIPERDGFVFQGWCTVQVADDASCTGTEYQPGDNYNIDYTAINTINLYARWETDTVNLAITFAGSGVSSVKVCTVSGNCSSNNLVGTVSSSGGSVTGLTSNTTYYLYPIFRTSNYAVNTWKKTSATGTLAGVSTQNTTTTTNNPTFVMTSGDSAVTLTGRFTGTYIQELTLSQCQRNVGTNGNASNVGDNITVFDRRSENYPSGDEGDYTVRYINGACWMTQNLRVRGTISSTYSNFSGSSFNVSAYDSKTNGASGGQCDNTNSYNNACSHVPDSTDLASIGSGATLKSVGVWYNFMAATAGAITTDANKVVPTTDICPSGWHLPTGPARESGTDFYKIFQSTVTTAISPNNYLTAFGATSAGFFNTGVLKNPTDGRWWATSATHDTSRNSLGYFGSDGTFFSGANYRHFSISIRCVRTS